MAEESRLVGLLLLQEFSQFGLAAVTESLFVANWLSGHLRYRWQTLSLDGRAVRSSAGQKLPVDAGIGEATRFDLLLVLASFDVKRLARDQALKAWLRRVARHGATIGSIVRHDAVPGYPGRQHEPVTALWFLRLLGRRWLERVGVHDSVAAA